MGTEIRFALDFRNKRFNDASKGLAALAKELNADWDGAAKVLSKELQSFLNSVAEALAKRHGNAWPGGTGEKTLSRRSGKLVASILSSVTVTGTHYDEIKGYIGAAFPGPVHEYGATIRPKTAKFLTVPLPAALNPNGTPKKKSAREWQNTFVARTKAGNLVIFQKTGTQIIPLYVLRTMVKIKPRLGMQETISAGLPYFVDRAADQIVRAMLAGASK
ncbi:hypothetical protein [Hyphomicrobium sp. ghe19]|uniref:hypothetical protein n=1 Tax=Hyphomicrobium sp. ghe19 TaxID=2682968 RepID=UPI001366AFB1|nr:hypothetical protein HYPP_02505 [Hyphomicrobium sp. ghe19]